MCGLALNESVYCDIYNIVLPTDLYLSTVFPFSWNNTLNHVRFININNRLKLIVGKCEETKCCVTTVSVPDTGVCSLSGWRVCTVICCEWSQVLVMKTVGGKLFSNRDFWVYLSMLFLCKEATYPKSSFTEKLYGVALVRVTRKCTPSFCSESADSSLKTFRPVLGVEGRILRLVCGSSIMVRESTTSVQSP